jgi:RES domain
MWTPDALASEARPYARDIWRVVETQAKAATMRITDTLEEQEILEAVLEESKPPFPPECVGFHYLLATPFRYAPYDHGSRFRRAHQPDGAFYASEEVMTAIAETAFYRLLFFAEATEMKLPARPVEHTAFSIGCRTNRHIDLTRPPLDRDRAHWTNPAVYAACQDLADAARHADIEVIRYKSVRNVEHRANVAALSPKVFTAQEPKALQTWHIFPRRHAVQAWCESPAISAEFKREIFATDPRIAGTSI